MGLFCTVVVCIAIATIVEPKSQISDGEERDVHKLLASLEKRVLALERAQEETERDNTERPMMLNDVDLEERVQALEVILAKGEDKSLASLLQNDSNLEERVEALESQMEIVEGEISIIDAEQDLQDTQIQLNENNIQDLNVDIEGITGTVTELTAVTDDLQVSMVSLQETDTGLIEDIAQLTEVDETFDSRLSQLEVDGTFGFHAVLGDYTSIPLGSVVVFPIVNLNLGNGYNAGTGNFITPVGGAGLYYFYAHFQVQQGERVSMEIRRDGVTLCHMAEAGLGHLVGRQPFCRRVSCQKYY